MNVMQHCTKVSHF